MIPHNEWVPRAEYVAAAARAINSGVVGPGPEVAAFERELAERFRPGDAAACVSSGTAALAIALKVLGARSVAVPTYACVSLAQACAMAGASWTPADDGAPKDIVVHTYGLPDEGALTHGVVEDFTHAPGATIGGRPCGSFGHASVISFGATKPLGVGSGGAVLGPPDLVAEVRDVRDYDRDTTGASLRRFNWQWSDVPAAMARARLALLDEENSRRAEIVRAYDPSVRSAPGRVWYRYVRAERDVAGAIQFFSRRGVQAINPLRPDELLHRRLRFPDEAFPRASAFAAHTISLPLYPGLSDEDVRAVAHALHGLST